MAQTRASRQKTICLLHERVSVLQNRLVEEERRNSNSQSFDLADPSTSHSKIDANVLHDDSTEDTESLLQGLPSIQSEKLSNLMSPPSIRKKEYGPKTQTPDAGPRIESLMETYFHRLHRKPYHILDESVTRRRWHTGKISQFGKNAICAVTVKYARSACNSHVEALSLSENYFLQSRAEIDMDQPRIEYIQALLLLALTSFQNGKGIRAYMLLSHATSMAFALELHRESPPPLCMENEDNEGCRTIFWTCYLMDKFMAASTKWPSAISDQSIHLRLPASQCPISGAPTEGIYFSTEADFTYTIEGSYTRYSNSAMLVRITELLGLVERYISLGGMIGDSGFPWHPQSTHECIRSKLEHWNAAFMEMYESLEVMFEHPESSILVLCELVYHLNYCLLYRPFLPMDLDQTVKSRNYGAWQAEAIRLSFLHADAIVEIMEKGITKGYVTWPPLVGYCILTAGTIHVHGAYYTGIRDRDLHDRSMQYLSFDMRQLADFRFIWASVYRYFNTLQSVYNYHSELVTSFARKAIHLTSVYQTINFFDRYPGLDVDEANIIFA